MPCEIGEEKVLRGERKQTHGIKFKYVPNPNHE